MPCTASQRLLFGVLCALVLWMCPLPGYTAALTVDQAKVLLKRVTAASCEASSPAAHEISVAMPPAARSIDEPLELRGRAVGWRGRWDLNDGGQIRVDRFAPDGRLRRIAVEFWEQAPRGGVRPALAAISNQRCEIREARRLVYPAGAGPAQRIELLDADLADTGESELLNPPVPEGTDAGGVPVALIDAGVNYLLPEIGERLAREPSGRILGYDYWDMDPRPFDAHPVPSPFFPQRHGTRTASLLLSEAPAVRLVPYRYPRPDMQRMGDLVSDAASKGVVVANLSMGSNERPDWDAFAAAAKAHPDMLFVVSAGNNGRDIDIEPVYPAALPLDNVITVTSSEHTGALAPGSNWGRRSVDLLVPAEHLAVTGFDGGRREVAGSSFAAVRISALAARLLASHPDWRAPQLKQAIFSRALPPDAGDTAPVSQGFIPRPDKADVFVPADPDSELREIARTWIGAEELHAGQVDASYELTPTFAYFAHTGWNLNRLRAIGRQAAGILAQCGVTVNGIDVRVLDGPDRFRYFREGTAKVIVDGIALPKPSLYFVRDSLQPDPYEAEAIGRGNSGTRPGLRDTVWVVEDVRDAGIAVAHELAHVLMDSGAHTDAPGNLMRAQTAPGDTTLSPYQCAQLVSTGVANGLLVKR